MGDTLLTGLLVRIPWLGPRSIYRLQRAGSGYPNSDWPDLVRSISRYRPDVVSVDVFDTCVVRTMVGDAVVEHAIDNRWQSEGSSSSATGGRAALAAEFERTHCEPVPDVADALDHIRQAEAEVVFLSDTDRSSELLTEILRSNGLFVDGDRLISSCEAGATKSSGELFRRVWPGGSGSGRAVWHIGNHLWADVAMAASSGIVPVPMIEADANRYEQAMAQRQFGVGPAVAGAARLARLDIEADRRSGRLDQHQAEIQILGAAVAGQVMTAFVLWMAEQCRADGVEHLGFLARDGELPLNVARAMPADHWDGRSLHYIHCSRLTWSLAAAAAIGVERWVAEGTTDSDAFLHAKRHQIPFANLLARVGLDRSDLKGDARYRDLFDLEPHTVLPEGAAADWEGLLGDPDLQDRIAERADKRLELIVDRLRADAIPEGKFGLVDVGWRGRLASHASAVLAQVVGEEPVHYHFGGDKVLADVDARIQIKRFAFDGVGDPFPIEAPVSCIETLTASGKPRVVDYRRRPDDEVELVFDKAQGSETGGRSEMWTGALRMAERIPARADLDRWGLESHSLADEVLVILDNWWNRPTEVEVEALRGLSFEHDEAGTSFRPLIAPYRITELRPGQDPVARQWPQGSRVVSSGLMARIATMVWSGRRWRRRLGR